MGKFVLHENQKTPTTGSRDIDQHRVANSPIVLLYHVVSTADSHRETDGLGFKP